MEQGENGDIQNKGEKKIDKTKEGEKEINTESRSEKHWEYKLQVKGKAKHWNKSREKEMKEVLTCHTADRTDKKKKKKWQR